MTDVDADARRIRDAFEHDLAGYHAPADLAERACAGGRRRASRRRMHRMASVAAACAAAVAGLLIVSLTGTAPSGGGVAPFTISAPAVSPLPSFGRSPGSRAGLPPAASVGKAMLTAFDAATGDIVYQRQLGIVHGVVADEYQLWTWPAQPAPGRQALMRDVYARRIPASAKALTLAEDYGLAYATPAPGALSEKFQLTMVCYPGPGGCGWGRTQTPAGTWSRASFRSASITTDVAPGSELNPAAIAREIITGQWRIVGRTRLDGQPAIELRESRTGALLPRNPQPVPGLLWVNARTHLPIRWITGAGTSSVTQQDYEYLPPTPANLALLQVPIPRDYPRSNPFRS